MELAGQRARDRRHPRGVRRLAVPSRRQSAVRPGAAGPGHRLRHQRQVHRRREEGGPRAARTHDLSALRAILSTGSPLVAESFDFVYRSIKEDLHLASISGGTDIVSCFALGNPIAPVWRGELQTRGLGMAVEVWNERGRAGGRRARRAGLREAVPLDAGGLLERSGRQTLPQRLLRALPRRLDPWRPRRAHAARRSDHLRPLGRGAQSGRRAHRHRRDLSSGRAGPEVVEALAVGQEWDGDQRVVLFVRLAEGRPSTMRWSSGSGGRSAPTARLATFRRRSCRSPTSRAP